MAPNNGYFSASEVKSSLNGGYLPTELLIITLRVSVYRQSAFLGDNPLRPTTSDFFN
jgi:hypothetical protein